MGVDARSSGGLCVVVAWGAKGRGVVLGRGASVAALVVLGGLAVAAATSTTLLLTRDAIVARLMQRNVDTHLAYEARIARLRDEVDAATSRRLLDQDGVETQLSELIRRQSRIESRHAAIADLVGSAPRPSARAAPDAADAKPSPFAATRRDAPETTSSFLPLTPKPRVAPEGPVGLRPAAGDERAWLAVPGPADLPGRLHAARLEALRLETAQLGELKRFEATKAAEASSIRAALASAGLAERFLPADAKRTARGGVGGPLVPLPAGGAVDPAAREGFDELVRRTRLLLRDADLLRGALRAAPLRRPVTSLAEVSSDFGPRLDPFTRSVAMHTGTDFRAPTGTAVRSAGAGVVVSAGWSGGYGNLVEIDHGHGVTSRYAHLSTIGVTEGQTIDAGAPLGRVGSTGRSTGPHLHYEVRLDGEAVDPQRFLKAARALPSP